MFNWSKVYSRINWLNKPVQTTPLSASNLNTVDYATNEMDNRIISLDTTKLDLSVANGMVKSFALNSATGVITVTLLDGTVATYDTKLEKIAINFKYNATTQQLEITLDDGTKQYVDMSALITQYEFQDTTTVGFTSTSGKVSATIKNGSVTDAMLQPSYLADITAQATNASSSATSAQTSANDADYDAKLAQSYSVGVSGIREGEATDNAKYYCNRAAEITNVDSYVLKSNTVSLIGDSVGSATFGTDGNMRISTLRRGCVVGMNTSIITSPYYKVASVISTEINQNLDITLHVKKNAISSESNLGVGILKVSCRTSGLNKFKYGAVVWEICSGNIEPLKFILAYNDNVAPTTFELWVKIDEAYQSYQFDVISENRNWLTRATNVWTLYDTVSAGSQAEITSGYTQIVSTVQKIKNLPSATTFGNTVTEDYIPLSAKHANPKIPGSLAEQIATVNSNLASLITTSVLLKTFTESADGIYTNIVFLNYKFITLSINLLSGYSFSTTIPTAILMDATVNHCIYVDGGAVGMFRISKTKICFSHTIISTSFQKALVYGIS